MSNKTSITIIFVLSFILNSIAVFGQTDSLDKSIFNELTSRLSDKGKNPVFNYQLYFNYKDKYVFNDAAGVVAKGKTTLTAHHKFKSASVSKTMIAVMILQLEEEGLIDLKKSLNLYLDSSVFNELLITDKVDQSQKLTIEKLLNQTAGLADYIMDDKRFLLGTYLFPKRQFSPEEHLTRYKKHNLNEKSETPFGTFHYSDTHYLLLAMLIEKVTGESLQSNLLKRITLKANMKSTYVDNWDSVYVNVMHQYLNRKDITETLHPSFEFGGGGFMTTTLDLGLFMKSLFADNLFSNKETLNKMLAINSSNYGLGIMKKEIQGNWITKNSTDTLIAYGHDGYYGIEMYHIPTENITWVTSMGQGYSNKHVNYFPIWLTLIRACKQKYAM